MPSARISRGTIVLTWGLLKSAAVSLALRSARAAPTVARPVAVAVTSKGPRHDEIPSRPFVPSQADVAGPLAGLPRRLGYGALPGLFGFLGRAVVRAGVLAAIAFAFSSPHATPAPAAMPSHDASRPWYSVVLVKTAGKPLEPLYPADREPDMFYPTRGACMAATRNQMRPLAAIGIHGRFACMYPRQPDADLALDPIEIF